MTQKFPDITCFLDVAGRYSRNKDMPLVFAAIGMWSSSVDEVRDSLTTIIKSGFGKWSDSNKDPKSAKAIFRLIVKRQLYGHVEIIWKESPAWDVFQEEGNQIHAKGVINAQEAIPYAKPMSTLKLQLFGRVMAKLWGHILGVNRHRLPSRSTPLESVTVTGVFDSDIEGQKNQEIFRTVLEGVDELPRVEEETGIRTLFKVSIKTEEEEPLLLLADHLAGYYYSRKVYGVGLDNDRRETLQVVEPIVEKWPSYCYRVIEGPFEEKYCLKPDVFDNVLPKKQREALLNQLSGSKGQVLRKDNS
jgi:hypothetical protein